MICQRCRLPVTTHSSLSNLSRSQISIFNRDDSEPSLQSTIFGSPSEEASFIVLSESIAGPNPLKQKQSAQQLVHVKTMSHEAEMLEKLFDYISANTDVDVPLCGECAETVRSGLKILYSESCAERDKYIGFLNKLKDEPAVGSQEVQVLLREIRDLENQNASALSELKQAEREKADAEKELEQIQDEVRGQKSAETSMYEQRNLYELEFNKLEIEKHRLEAITDYQMMQLHRLERTNVYNDVFCIGHDGLFGTINGLRLGRLRDKKVEWSEINAALGQTLFLLATMIHKLGMTMPEYRLRPLGSMSRIDKINLDPETGAPTGKVTSLELYSSGDYSLERLLNHKRLDAAMVALLDILDRIGKFVEDADSTLKLPYAIDRDKIGGCSIRLSMSTSNETWTAACKYVLTNSKWILAYVISQ